MPDAAARDVAGGAERLGALRRRLVEARVPASGSLNLTDRCNLRCAHCYLGGGRRAGAEGRPELATRRWLSVIDQAADEGCLDLVLTGGEPLLRKDFDAIYRRARTRGIYVTVFTNGTLVDDGHMALFRDLPPSAVEVSLYGATEETCDRVTGVPGSWRRCLEGVGRLRRLDIELSLKTVLLTLNFHELDAMERIAADMGAGFRFDPAILPRLDGDRAPVALRVPPAEAAGADFADPGRARAWREYYDRTRDMPGAEGLYACGAGLTNFHVDAGGTLRPCVIAREPSYDLTAGPFRTGWREVIPRLREEMPREGYPCGDCDKKAVCGLCPALSALECGEADRPSRYLCALGEHRLRAIREGAGGDPGSTQP